jgi:hypothetical protein
MFLYTTNSTMHLIYTTDKGECRFLKIHITGIEENGGGDNM